MSEGVMVVLEIQGDTEALLRASDEIERLMPAVDGLLVRVIAPADDGIVLFQLWKSEAARERNAADPEHARVLQESGVHAAAAGMRSRAYPGAALRQSPGAVAQARS